MRASSCDRQLYDLNPAASRELYFAVEVLKALESVSVEDLVGYKK